MNIGEALRIALRGLRANRLRSALTTLGIVIGVAAVIILTALGNGIQSGFTDTFGSLATQITVTPSEGSAPGGGTPRPLIDGDVDALANPANAPDIVAITPIVAGTALLQSDAGGQYRSAVTGTTANFFTVTDREILVGAAFTEAQANTKAKVVLLGPNPVAELFGGDAGAAIGQELRIGRASFRIIGVFEGDGQQDDLAIMPLDTARSYLLGGDDDLSSVIIKAASADRVDAALEQVNTVLDRRHRINDPGDRDFDAQALRSLLDQSSQFLTFLTLFTTAVAAISLIVGGIGVANIMLVTVTERTREIGIRKAIGARRRAILQQFLLESMLLAGLGGLVGIVFGVGIALAGAAVLPRLVPDFPPPTVSVGPIVLAFLISLAIGLIAGGVPANRAARLRPIEALRYQ